MLGFAFLATLICVLFGLRCLGWPTRLLVGVAEVGAITCRFVAVLGAKVSISRGGRTVGAGFFTVVAPDTGEAVAFLGQPVSLLCAQVTLVGAFDEDLDVGVGLDGVHLGQDRVLIALALVGLCLAPVGYPFSLIGLPVTSFGLPVPQVCLAVSPIGFPIPAVRRRVPLSRGVALLRGVVTLVGRPVS